MISLRAAPLVLIQVAVLALFASGAAAVECREGYKPASGEGCLPPGFIDCGGGTFCTPGFTCGEGVCIVPTGTPNGPWCLHGFCIPGSSCVHGHCFNTSLTFFCGNTLCSKGVIYPPRTPCAPCQARLPSNYCASGYVYDYKHHHCVPAAAAHPVQPSVQARPAPPPKTVIDVSDHGCDKARAGHELQITNRSDVRKLVQVCVTYRGYHTGYLGTAPAHGTAIIPVAVPCQANEFKWTVNPCDDVGRGCASPAPCLH